jgi:3-phosphoglycerate kinase
MDKKTVRDIEVSGKKVLVRVDFNVPMDDKGQITDDTRIQAALPTINYLLEQKAKVILVSHLGRPKGKVNPKYSLKTVAQHLAQVLGREVKFAPEAIGPETTAQVNSLQDGDILLLENIRFYEGEEKNDANLSKALARAG